MRINNDVNVVLGCGLGGTSLINANVGLRAEPRVFDDPAWPEDIRKDAALLEQGYEWATRMLKPKPVPDTFPSLAEDERARDVSQGDALRRGTARRST